MRPCGLFVLFCVFVGFCGFSTQADCSTIPQRALEQRCAVAAWFLGNLHELGGQAEGSATFALLTTMSLRSAGATLALLPFTMRLSAVTTHAVHTAAL